MPFGGRLYLEAYLKRRVYQTNLVECIRLYRSVDELLIE